MASWMSGMDDVDRAIQESVREHERYERSKLAQKEALAKREHIEGAKPGHEPVPVLSWLYLGDRFTVRDPKILIKARIAYVLQISAVETPDEVKGYFKQAHIRQYLRLPAEDVETDNIIMEFGKADNFVDLGKQAWDSGDEFHRVLIYCDEGISRSPTVVLAYLLHQGWTLKGAVHYLKRLRPAIAPNKGFFAQLIEKEKQLFGRTTLEESDYNSLFVE
jgi:protein-tyrosine phosphatase